jgi:hypothetical protein
MAQVAKRVRKHRAKLKAAGLKPVTIWVPDPSRPGFAEEIRRQCELVNASTDSERVLDEMLAVADFSDWK